MFFSFDFVFDVYVYGFGDICCGVVDKADCIAKRYLDSVAALSAMLISRHGTLMGGHSPNRLSLPHLGQVFNNE